MKSKQKWFTDNFLSRDSIGLRIVVLVFERPLKLVRTYLNCRELEPPPFFFQMIILSMHLLYLLSEHGAIATGFLLISQNTENFGKKPMCSDVQNS